MAVVGVRVDEPKNQPVLLLREVGGERYLPIWIGQYEATAIALQQQGVRPARPLTHDLIESLLTSFEHNLLEVRIDDVRDGTYYADLVFDDERRVSARPSDAIALALRMAVPIFADETVLERAAVTLDETDSAETPEQVEEPPVTEAEVEEFKQFLDTVSPDDFRASDG